jgi:hypothetical protein
MGSAQTELINGILLLYHHPLSVDAATVMENVRSFEQHSRFKVWSVNSALGFPASLKDSRFRCILLHYSIFGQHYALDQQFLDYLEQSSGSYKVASFQDEYQYCRQRFDFLNRHKIDCVYTLVEEIYFKDFYQKYTSVPKLISHIPGYVSRDLVEMAGVMSQPETARSVDVGYRGRRLPIYTGSGAREKTEIALRFTERAEGLGLNLNIGTEESQRIYGDDWYRFLANCKAVLGVEAGVSYSDTEDVVRTEYERLIAKNPDLTFQELWDAVPGKWEGHIPQRLISPRHFEAAALRVCQILYEGKYSEAMQPLKHYIPLKRDFSNFDEVIRMFRDEGLRRELTENAYRDLIASGNYSYERFVDRFDQELMKEGLRPELDENMAAEITRRLDRERKLLLLRAKKNDVLYHKAFPGRALLAFLARPPLKVLRRLKQMRN